MVFSPFPPNVCIIGRAANHHSNYYLSVQRDNQIYLEKKKKDENR